MSNIFFPWFRFLMTYDLHMASFNWQKLSNINEVRCPTRRVLLIVIEQSSHFPPYLIYTLASQLEIIPLLKYCESGAASLFFNLLSSRSIPESFSTVKLWPASKCIQSEWTWFLLQDPGVTFMSPFSQHLFLWAQIKLTLFSKKKLFEVLRSNGSRYM